MKKRIEIQLDEVEAQMLLLLQRKNIRYKNIERYFKDLIAQEDRNMRTKS
jgi:hypothetical protein